ncbi:MAG: hypothetical protein ACJ8I9_03390, partial [Chthoniobacterales bacterium]
NQNDVVTSLGTSYIVTALSATGMPGAIDSTGWSLMASKGDSGIAGSSGAQGPMGPIGLTGPQGPIGVAGPKGDKGDTGLTGATGAQGPQGPVGPAGPQGAGLLQRDIVLRRYGSPAPAGFTKVGRMMAPFVIVGANGKMQTMVMDVYQKN